MQKNSGTEKRPRRLSISIRMMLAMFVVVAIGLAWLAKERRESAVDRQVGLELEKLGMSVISASPLEPLESALNDEGLTWWQGIASGLVGDKPVAVWPMRCKDLSPISKLSRLEYLHITGNTNVEDLLPLSRQDRLRKLVLTFTSVTDIAPLRNHCDLEFIAFANTPIRDVSPLQHCRHLTYLDLTFTKVADLRPLSGLTKLQDLYLEGTAVADLTPLDVLKSLKTLNLRSTNCTDEQIKRFEAAHPNCQILR